MEESKREAELSKMYGVKDERTGHQTGNIQAVLDGALAPLIEAFLRWKGRTD